MMWESSKSFAFIRLSDGSLVRAGLIQCAEEEWYASGVVTHIYLMGKKDPVIYHGPVSEVWDLLAKLTERPERPEEIRRERR